MILKKLPGAVEIADQGPQSFSAFCGATFFERVMLIWITSSFNQEKSEANIDPHNDQIS
jgi:hypothetical protein